MGARRIDTGSSDRPCTHILPRRERYMYANGPGTVQYRPIDREHLGVQPTDRAPPAGPPVYGGACRPLTATSHPKSPSYRPPRPDHPRVACRRGVGEVRSGTGTRWVHAAGWSGESGEDGSRGSHPREESVGVVKLAEYLAVDRRHTSPDQSFLCTSCTLKTLASPTGCHQPHW